jgi:hypothetical protein
LSPRGFLGQPSRRATAKSRARPLAGDNDPAVGLERDRVAGRGGAEVDGRLPGGAERGVGRSVGVEARDGDAGLRGPDDDDLAVRLQHRAAGSRRPEVDGRRAIAVERGVGRPVRVQPRDGRHLA